MSGSRRTATGPPTDTVRGSRRLEKIFAVIAAASALLQGQPPPPPPLDPPQPPRCCSTRPPGRTEDIQLATGEIALDSAKADYEIVRKVRGLLGRTESAKEGVSQVLTANEKVIPTVFQVKLEALEAYSAVQDQDSSTLTARWRASGPFGLVSIGVEDRYSASTFVLECRAAALREPKRLVSELFRWRSPPVDLDWLNIRLGLTEQPDRYVLVGGTHLMKGPRPIGQGFWFGTFADNGQAHVVVTMGKRTLEHEVARYRFPPLSVTAKSMSTGDIFGLLRQMGASPGEFDLLATDTSALIEELVRRGASDDELIEAMYNTSSDVGFQSKLMSNFTHSRYLLREIARREGLLKQMLNHSLRDQSTGTSIDGSLEVLNVARAGKLDFEKPALAFAMSAKDPTWALVYLGEVSSSPETLEGVKKLLAARPNLGMQIRLQIDNITARISFRRLQQQR